MIRLAWCLDQFEVGGTELNAIRWAERLDRDRFDLQVVALSERGELLDRYRDLGVNVTRFPIRSLYRPATLVQGRRLARYLRAEKVQVLHSHDLYANIFSLPWARAAGVPAVLANRRWWKSPDSRLLREANRWASGRAHRILTNSRAVADMIQREERVPPDRVRIIWNFLEEAAFERPSDAWIEARRTELGIPAGSPVVGAVARLHPDKDHGLLLEAMVRVREEHPNAVLVLVGDGPERGTLEERADALGVREAVRFAGHRPSRPSFHHLFDVSALASRTEGFPNTLLEAMGAARPVVATRIMGNVDAVSDGRTGLLVPVGDVGAASEALDRLLSDARLRSEMGQAGRERARTVFTQERTLEALMSAYEELLAAGTGLDPTEAGGAA